jgi:16S rRNA C967 or C1407 C5-methylase (RsmB/RsmF family)/NOL1/NOP2/fmu family ribosome biogenesis protein
MFPEGFIQRIHNQKYIDSKALLKALKETSPVSIRINPSKWNKIPLNSEPVRWCKNGYYLVNRPSYTLDPLFHSGCYYPQEASSMFLEQSVQQVSGSMDNIRVLDLCGAPGGKSTHLANLIGPTGLLVANEVIRSRAQVLAESITKWGYGNTLVTQNDPAAFGRLPGYFDIILVDAPCSGEGMFRSDVVIKEWSGENTFHCSERQKRIVMDVWPALKENGILIYSTCTFNPGENEENIRWLTNKQEAESVGLNIADFNGINEIDYQGIYGYGFYPDKIRGDGFFISVIRKTAKQPKIRISNGRKKELAPLKNELAVAEQWTDFLKERILKWRDEVFAVPCIMEDYLCLFKNLKIEKAGTKIFVVKKQDYLPSPDLALSIHLRKGIFPSEETSLSQALAYLKRDNLMPASYPKGWNIVTYKSANIGFVKNLGNRVNNYYPAEWRIRMKIPEAGNENIINWND